MTINNKKAAFEFSLKKLVVLVLILIVLVIVFMSIFKPGIWDWIVNLPGYEYEGDRDETVVVDSEKEYLCLFNVAKIIGGGYSSDEIKFCEDEACSKLKDSKVIIDWDKPGISGEIEIDQNINEVIGKMEDQKIIIFSDIFKGRGIYEDVKGDLPSYEYLIKLDGAYFSEVSGNLICRPEKAEYDSESKKLIKEYEENRCVVDENCKITGEECFCYGKIILNSLKQYGAKQKYEVCNPDFYCYEEGDGCSKTSDERKCLGNLVTVFLIKRYQALDYIYQAAIRTDYYLEKDGDDYIIKRSDAFFDNTVGKISMNPLSSLYGKAIISQGYKNDKYLNELSGLEYEDIGKKFIREEK
jgi:hypothetical protein